MSISKSEFAKLPLSKQVDVTVKLFLYKTKTRNLYRNGRIISDYYPIRKFMSKWPTNDIKLVYYYLLDGPNSISANVYEIRILAKNYQKHQAREENNKAIDELGLSNNNIDYLEILNKELGEK